MENLKPNELKMVIIINGDNDQICMAFQEIKKVLKECQITDVEMIKEFSNNRIQAKKEFKKLKSDMEKAKAKLKP